MAKWRNHEMNRVSSVCYIWKQNIANARPVIYTCLGARFENGLVLKLSLLKPLESCRPVS